MVWFYLNITSGLKKKTVMSSRSFITRLRRLPETTVKIFIVSRDLLISR